MTPSDINRVLLTGRLTADPDLRVLPSGRNRCLLSLEVRSRQRNPDSGDWAQRVQFLDTVAFGALAESCASDLSAGALLTIDGSLDLRGWENETGDCVEAMTIIADIVQRVTAPPQHPFEPQADELAGAPATELLAAAA